MSDIDMHQLAAAYALDALDERERSEFEAHYPTCSSLPSRSGRLQRGIVACRRLRRCASPASLKSKVMAEIGSTRQLSPLLPESVVSLAAHRQRRQRMARMLTVAAAALLDRRRGVRRRSATRATATTTHGLLLRSGQCPTPGPRRRRNGRVAERSGSRGRPADSKAVVIGDGLPDPGRGRRTSCGWSMVPRARTRFGCSTRPTASGCGGSSTSPDHRTSGRSPSSRRRRRQARPTSSSPAPPEPE